MPNIKEQLLREITDPNIDFAFPFSKEQKKRDFQLLATKFLQSRTYAEMERYGSLLMLNSFKQHGKSEQVGPVLDVMNNYEFYFDYRFRSRQKVHFIHLTNVFLLGLYLYHKVPKIRQCFDEANKIDSPITLKIKRINKKTIEKYWYYSGGSIFMEFLYRWRLASLSHDIGIPIQQAEGNTEKINEHLEEFGAVTGTRLNDLDNILNFKSKFLNVSFPKNDSNLKIYNPEIEVDLKVTSLEYLDNMIEHLSLSDYMEYQYKHPLKNEIFHDHGIFGALIYLIIMDKSYKKNDKKPRTNRSIWHPFLFQTSIIKTAKAIALHNLNKNEEALIHSLNNKSDLRFIDIEREPIAWLLKITDLIQIWDKPYVDNFNNSIHTNLISIDFEDENRIFLNGFNEKANIIREEIEKYTKAPINFEWNNLVNFTNE